MTEQGETLKSAGESAPVVVVVNEGAEQLDRIISHLELDHLCVHGFQRAGEALAALETGLLPDLIVTDLHTPDIDGWRCCRLLRSPQYPAFNRTPILITSTRISGRQASRITADLGANGFLPGPFEGGRLRRQVRALLAGESAPEASTVLIVEDDPGVRQFLQTAFEVHGYQVVSAGTAAGGRAAFLLHTPQIVLLDHHLPDFPGQDLLREFKARSPGVVVVMMTGDPSPKLAVELMRWGADAYAQKPFLAEYVITLCQQASRERELLGGRDPQRQAGEAGFAPDAAAQIVRALVNAEPRLSPAALERSEERFRLALEATTDGLWDWDIANPGRCYFSPGYYRMLGWEPGEFPMSAEEWMARLHPEDLDRAVAANLECIENRAPRFEVECRLRTKTGDWKWVLARGKAASRNSSGRATRLVGTHLDITERKRAEEERERLCEQARREAQTKSDLLSEVNHRVKNTLVAIQGLLIAEERSAPAEGRAHVQAAMEHLSRRIGGLLDVHQMLSDSEWTPMELGDLAAGIIQCALHGAPRDCEIVVDVPPSRIEVSPRQSGHLALVFNELATNSLKHALPGRSCVRIGVRAWMEGEWTVVEYRDDGPGFPDGAPLGPSGGVGLGLVRQLVGESLRGRLELRNDSGAVSTLRFRPEFASPA